MQVLERKCAEMESFLIRAYAQMQSSVEIEVNTIVTIKEILKSCNPREFDEK